MRFCLFFFTVSLTATFALAQSPEAVCRANTLIPKGDFALSVKTNYRKTDTGYELVVQNAEKFPVYLNVTMKKLVNLKSGNGKSFIFRAEPGAETILNTLTIVDAQKANTFDYTYLSQLTDLAKFKTDRKLVYALPYDTGVSSQIIQGYRGKFSHNTELNLNALDFSLPRATRILAARGGVVVASRSDVTSGGYDTADLNSIDSAGNFVMVLHDDGTIANYFHLQCGGTKLAKGDRVETGDEIGYSGSTGYSHPDYPHLHFVVRMPDLQSPYGKKTVPTLFRVNGGTDTYLQEGKTYAKE